MPSYSDNRQTKFHRNTKYKRNEASKAKRVPSAPVDLKASVSSLVKSYMGRLGETKSFQVTNGSTGVYPYSAAGTLFADNNVIELGPNSAQPLTQGTGNSDRIGNKIRVKKATLQIILYPNGYDNVSNPFPRPQDVRLMIVHAKNNPTDVVVSSTYFDANNSTTSPADNLFDMIRPINKDDYVVSVDRRVKVGNAINEGTGFVMTDAYFSNNDYKYNQLITWDITSAFPTNITFNDTSAIPTSFQPTLVAMTALATGDTSGAATIPVTMWSNCILEYTDA